MIITLLLDTLKSSRCNPPNLGVSIPSDLLHLHRRGFHKHHETQPAIRNSRIAEQGNGRAALHVEPTLPPLQGMEDLPSIEALIGIIESCKRSRNVKLCKHLHLEVCKCGLESHNIIGNNIIQMFAACGSFADAHHAFSVLLGPNICTVTCLMIGYIQHDDVSSSQTIDLYEQMMSLELHPNRFTFMALLKACISLNDLNRGRDVYAEIVCRGLEADAFIESTLVDMYGKCWSIQEAEDVFGKLLIRNVVAWSAMLMAYVEHGHAMKARECYEKMQSEEGISPDNIAYIAMLKACGSLKDMHEARQMHNSVVSKGLEREGHVGNCLTDMYAKCGSLQEAHQVLNKLPLQDVVSWTALLAGYSEHGSDKELLLCFDKIQAEGFSPDVNTFTSVLKVCGKMGAIEKG